MSKTDGIAERFSAFFIYTVYLTEVMHSLNGMHDDIKANQVALLPSDAYKAIKASMGIILICANGDASAVSTMAMVWAPKPKWTWVQ